jgi:hypothetical protein
MIASSHLQRLLRCVFRTAILLLPLVLMACGNGGVHY